MALSWKLLVLFYLFMVIVNGKPVSDNDELETLRQDLSEIKDELKRFEEEKKSQKATSSRPKYEEVSQRKKNKKHRKFHTPAEQEASPGAYESDMNLTPAEVTELKNTRFRRKAVQNEMKLWPSGKVYYEFENGLDTSIKKAVKDAMRHWEKHTCIRFVPYSTATSGPSDRIRFSKGPGCRADIGRRGGLQEIMISDTCKDSMGSVAHEIAHAAGFYHEHSRPDRDDHIRVHMENIKDGYERDFDKLGTRTIHDIEPYDLTSVMHYGPTYFSRNGKMTLEPNDDKQAVVMGQRDGLSFLDIKTANELYKCSASCQSSMHCLNGGFIGPNCACVCPVGLTGRDCSEVVQGTTDCGGVFREPTGVITTPNYPNQYDTEAMCYWLIQGPEGSHVTLQFEDFEVEEDERCDWDYVEVLTHGIYMGGTRYCGENPGFKNIPTDPIEYPGNALLIKLKSDDGYEFRGFKARYTIHN